MITPRLVYSPTRKTVPSLPAQMMPPPLPEPSSLRQPDHPTLRASCPQCPRSLKKDSNSFSGKRLRTNFLHSLVRTYHPPSLNVQNTAASAIRRATYHEPFPMQDYTDTIISIKKERCLECMRMKRDTLILEVCRHIFCKDCLICCIRASQQHFKSNWMDNVLCPSANCRTPVMEMPEVKLKTTRRSVATRKGKLLAKIANATIIPKVRIEWRGRKGLQAMIDRQPTTDAEPTEEAESKTEVQPTIEPQSTTEANPKEKFKLNGEPKLKNKPEPANEPKPKDEPKLKGILKHRTELNPITPPKSKDELKTKEGPKPKAALELPVEPKSKGRQNVNREPEPRYELWPRGIRRLETVLEAEDEPSLEPEPKPQDGSPLRAGLESHLYWKNW
ncbi:hypothetical protein CC80DRAFT_240223 [Byssothecium circinans]|uniref:RING-type domain-containing protein n=1 Tax=Byssothecium circinans TaxID=147558 RepID=A0A6A5TC28_9PLEO|nr:hypothetical protein CC80DRAFT_240223 [Byssothecium circinans]